MNHYAALLVAAERTDLDPDPRTAREAGPVRPSALLLQADEHQQEGTS